MVFVRQTLSTIRRLRILATWVVSGVGLCASPAKAETIQALGPAGGNGTTASAGSAGIDWQWSHQASGWGEARVFDNGPVVTDSDATTGPNDDFMQFVPVDRVGSGVNSASYRSTGSSRVTVGEQGLGLSLRFLSSYSATGPPGGPRPGGRGEGKLSSTFEFVMPAEAPLINLFMFIVEDSGYEGDTLVTIDNVTQFERLYTLSAFTRISEILSQPQGDLIRVTTEISGGGGVPARPDYLRGIRVKFQPVVSDTGARDGTNGPVGNDCHRSGEVTQGDTRPRSYRKAGWPTSFGGGGPDDSRSPSCPCFTNPCTSRERKASGPARSVTPAQAGVQAV